MDDARENAVAGGSRNLTPEKFHVVRSACSVYISLDIHLFTAYGIRMSVHPPAPRSRHCLLARIDYGYSPLTARGWAEADLFRQPPGEALKLSKGVPGLVVRRAEWALAWAGTRDGKLVWERFAAIARRAGLALECRFPRHARELAVRIESVGLEPDRWETAADGSVPPLYDSVGDRPDLLHLHLQREWDTGLAAARGGAALLRIAIVLSRQGAMPAPRLSEELGLTTGACRAYLGWMEDAALVRRTGRAFDLRHPLLGSLFVPAPAERSAPRPRRPAQSVAAASHRPPETEVPVYRPSDVDWD